MLGLQRNVSPFINCHSLVNFAKFPVKDHNGLEHWWRRERGWKRERERERRKREKLRENWDHFGNYLSMVTTLTFVDIWKGCFKKSWVWFWSFLSRPRFRRLCCATATCCRPTRLSTRLEWQRGFAFLQHSKTFQKFVKSTCLNFCKRLRNFIA